MRVAVIGGGAAGLTTAYLLDGAHEVTVFEKESVLGGHIRTLGRNVACQALPHGVYVDAGVIEFEETYFPTVHALFRHLGVEVFGVPGSTALFVDDNGGTRDYYSPWVLGHTDSGPRWQIGQFFSLLRMLPSRRRFLRRCHSDELGGCTIGELLDDSVHSDWIRLLLTYAYSTPADRVDELPAALAAPMLREFLLARSWTAVRGGVYSYVERMLERMRCTIVLDARIEAIRRDDTGVTLRLADGEQRFDKVVIATPPHVVLGLLADPTPHEHRRFADWTASDVHTTIHTDGGLYERRGAVWMSEFDLFQRPGRTSGYNAFLNRLSSLSDEPPHYHLSFELDDEIDPARVLHTQPHTCPRYTLEAFAHRDEVIASNGERHTFYAGAWLGDGLHEGAVVSAVRVAERLGGRTLRV